MGGRRHILVPLDGSAFAYKALPHLEALCKAFGAKLTLASVRHITQIPDINFQSRICQKRIANAE